MPQQPHRIMIDELPDLENEAALFDAGIDAGDLSVANDHVIISLILNP